MVDLPCLESISSNIRSVAQSDDFSAPISSSTKQSTEISKSISCYSVSFEFLSHVPRMNDNNFGTEIKIAVKLLSNSPLQIETAKWDFPVP
jgi:hypothetical protein